MLSATLPSPADLRAEIARRQVRLYVLAARIGTNPVLLGRWLNGRLPMPAEAATRIAETLRTWEAPDAS